MMKTQEEHIVALFERDHSNLLMCQHQWASGMWIDTPLEHVPGVVRAKKWGAQLDHDVRNHKHNVYILNVPNVNPHKGFCVYVYRLLVALMVHPGLDADRVIKISIPSVYGDNAPIWISCQQACWYLFDTTRCVFDGKLALRHHIRVVWFTRVVVPHATIYMSHNEEEIPKNMHDEAEALSARKW